MTWIFLFTTGLFLILYLHEKQKAINQLPKMLEELTASIAGKKKRTEEEELLITLARLFLEYLNRTDQGAIYRGTQFWKEAREIIQQLGEPK